jgi:hypothetical protein
MHAVMPLAAATHSLSAPCFSAVTAHIPFRCYHCRLSALLLLLRLLQRCWPTSSGCAVADSSSCAWSPLLLLTVPTPAKLTRLAAFFGAGSFASLSFAWLSFVADW